MYNLIIANSLTKAIVVLITADIGHLVRLRSEAREEISVPRLSPSVTMARFISTSSSFLRSYRRLGLTFRSSECSPSISNNPPGLSGAKILQSQVICQTETGLYQKLLQSRHLEVLRWSLIALCNVYCARQYFACMPTWSPAHSSLYWHPIAAIAIVVVAQLVAIVVELAGCPLHSPFLDELD
jgi:hypothetical protein